MPLLGILKPKEPGLSSPVGPPLKKKERALSIAMSPLPAESQSERRASGAISSRASSMFGDAFEGVCGEMHDVCQLSVSPLLLLTEAQRSLEDAVQMAEESSKFAVVAEGAANNAWMQVNKS